MTVRDFSVFPVHVVGEAKPEYAKVRALDGALGVGRRVDVQRKGHTRWQRGRVVESQSAGTVWIELVDRT